MNYTNRLQEIADAKKAKNDEKTSSDKIKGEIAVKFLKELFCLFNEINEMSGREYFDKEVFNLKKVSESGFNRMLVIFYDSFSRYFIIEVEDDYLPYLTIANDISNSKKEKKVQGIDKAVELVLSFVEKNNLLNIK
jgi:hypothetical protein